MTKSAKIRQLLNLKMKPRNIAKKLGVTPNLVYQVAWADKKKPKKKKPTLKMKSWVEAQEAKQKPVKRDKKAEAWAKKNTWFGVDEAKTAFALGLHEKLLNEGVDPKSDTYYKKVDAGMKPLLAHDLVNNPPHYTDGGVDTLDFIEAKDLNFRLGNVIKYVSRAGKKVDSDPVQDLEKAAFYLQREIEARKGA